MPGFPFPTWLRFFVRRGAPWVALVAIGSALAAGQIPEGGKSMIAEPAVATGSLRNQSDSRFGTVTFPLPDVLEVHVATRPEHGWFTQLVWLTNQPVVSGHRYLVTFEARTLASASETGEGLVDCMLQDTTRWNGDGLLSTSARIPKRWTTLSFPFTSRRDEPAGTVQFSLNFGTQVQRLQIRNLRLLSYGTRVPLSALPRTKFSYEGREPDAAWRKEADARIEKLRKSDFSLRVVDAAGKPVRNARVRVEMRRHAFRFGTAFSPWILGNNAKEFDRYREVLAQNFNEAGFEGEIVWHTWERGSEAERAERMLWVQRCLDFLRQHDLKIRGLHMVWPGEKIQKYVPDDVLDRMNDREYVTTRTEAFFRQMGGYLAPYVTDWNVVNEPYANRSFQKVYGEEIIVDWFKLSKKVAPRVGRYANDFTILSGGAMEDARIDWTERYLRDLIAKGAPIDGIGEQAHFSDTPVGMGRMKSLLDRFAKFGLPISITEFDQATTDEQLQADFLRDFYTMAFSHPAVDRIMMWGFWEGSHWMPDAALWRKDWTLKPNGKAFLDLVFRRWWTNLTGVTNASGTYSGRGFQGDYRITVEANGRTVRRNLTLPPTPTRLTIRL